MRTFGLVLILLLLPAHVFAFGLTLGVGVKGGMNGSVANGVEEGDSFTVDGNQFAINQGPDIYPMFGVGGAVGPVIEVRALDIVGLEIGLLTSWDNGSGFEDKNAVGGGTIGRIDQKQTTRSLRLPISAKASVPGFVRPTFGLGVELVFQGKSELRYSSDNILINQVPDGYQFSGATYNIEPSTYATFLFSFALEFDIMNFRIPIELRGNLNTGFKRDLEPRLANATGGPGNFTLTYDGKYQAHFALFTGVVYDFDFLF